MMSDATSNAFADGLAKGVVRVRTCAMCGITQTLDPRFCAHCGSSDLAWTETDGRGRVHSLTEVHRAPSPAYRALAPYMLVLVDLDDGGRMMGHGAPGLAIGTAVTASVCEEAGQRFVRFAATQERGA